MSTSTALSCPMCLKSDVFESVQSLRDRLVIISTVTVKCPICQEEVCGISKLVTHLLCHINIPIESNKVFEKNQNLCEIKKKTNDTSDSPPSKQQKSRLSKNKPSSNTSQNQIKYVKIFPKLPVVNCKKVVSDKTISNREQSICDNGNAINFQDELTVVQPSTTCDICHLQFVDANILKMHKCLIHNIEDKSEHSEPMRYHCHLCPKNFKMRGSLMVHLRVTHFGLSNSNSSKSYFEKGQEENRTEAAKLDDNLVKNENKQWQCDVCLKCFTTKYFLKKHKRLHTGETPYACTQCSKTFTFQQSYHKHLIYHNDEKPHVCNYCGRAFKELSTLHNHQRIHTGEKPFSCETCGKCFRQRVSYLVHRRIHTGVMPYKCTACDKSFRYKVSQRTHKCQAKPPGTVIRQSGHLVEKLKKKQTDDTLNFPPFDRDLNFTNITFNDVSEANAELVRSGAKLSLEDMETDNFNFIADAFYNDENKNSELAYPHVLRSTVSTYGNVLATDENELTSSFPLSDENIPSPSEIFKNLCLSSDGDHVLIEDNTILSEFDIPI